MAMETRLLSSGVWARLAVVDAMPLRTCVTPVKSVKGCGASSRPWVIVVRIQCDAVWWGCLCALGCG